MHLILTQLVLQIGSFMKQIRFYPLILILVSMQTYSAPIDLLFSSSLMNLINVEPVSISDINTLIVSSEKDHYIKTKYRSTEMINFSSASAVIQPTSYDLLRQYGSAMEDGVSDSVILIEGHTDSIGSEQDNYNLSYKRVLAIKKFLTSFYNISPDRILVKAYGEKKPIATNMNAKGRSINRRVEFIRVSKVEN